MWYSPFTTCRLVAFSKAGPLTVSIMSFLFFKILATVGWGMPDWQAIAITDFPPVQSLITVNFIPRSLTQRGNINSVFCMLRGRGAQNNTRLTQALEKTHSRDVADARCRRWMPL